MTIQTVVVCVFIFLLVCQFSSPTVQPICKVYNTTSVDCEGRQLSDIPHNLPSFATTLDLSSNIITSIESDAFVRLYQLKTLKLFQNHITHIHSNAFRGLFALEHLHLERNEEINTIPGKLFSDLINLKTLDLSTNKIMKLSPSSFQGLYNLQRLKLNSNRMTDLPADIFKDLTKLELLDLENVKITCLGHSLYPLINIQTIYLHGNRLHYNCSHFNFKNLTKLTTLTLGFWITDIDSKKYNNAQDDFLHDTNKSETFGFSFDVLQDIPIVKLEWKKITSECMENTLHKLNASNIRILVLKDISKSITAITNTTLMGLQASLIEELNLSNNGLQTLPSNGFVWLQNLKTLVISYNDLKSIPSNAFEGLNNLTTLILQGNLLLDFSEVMICVNRLTKLTHLSIGQNNLHGDIPSFIFPTLDSLTSLRLYSNKFTTVHQDSFTLLSKLELLDLSRNLLYVLHPDSFTSLTKLEFLYLSHNVIYQPPHAVFSHLISLKVLHLEGNHLGSKNFIPDYHSFMNLTKLTVLWLTFPFTNIDFLYLEDMPSLQELHINSNVPYFVTGRDGVLPIKSISSFNTLQSANLSKLKILHIEYSYLDPIDTELLPFNSVKKLRLHKFSLGYSATQQDMKKLLELFPNVETLSVSEFEASADLNFLPDTLQYLNLLEIFDNQISQMNTDILKSYPQLRVLDVSHSAFDCSRCHAKDFVDWMEKDKTIELLGRGNYVCVTPSDKSGTLLFNLTFGLECNLAFMVSMPITCFLVTVFLTVTLCIRFHWHIRYLIFMIKLKRGGYQLQVNDDEDQPLNKKYDAFVVYNQHDRPWVMQQLVQNLENIDPPNFKLCIHDRDFIGGTDIFDNILDSIENSHKTMLILSPHFAESEWCYFEMRMAQDHLFTEKRDVILLVLLQEIPDNVMPRVLRKILKTKSCIKWTDNEVGRRLFWKKLKFELESGNRVNRVANI
ncbi:uncharacterized protein LOC144436541 [Glandiceps talaboti]